MNPLKKIIVLGKGEYYVVRFALIIWLTFSFVIFISVMNEFL